MNIKKLTTLSILAALVCVLTVFTRVPVVGSLVWHAGDSIIYVIALTIGGPFGAIAAGIGSSLADLFMGYAIFAIPTFIIKGLMCYTVFALCKKNQYMAMIVGGLVMIVGYFITNIILYGFGVALPGAGFDALQVAVSIILGSVLLVIIKKAKLI